MLSRAEVARRMLVLGTVAAADVTATSTDPQMDPRIAHRETLLTAAGVRIPGCNQ